MSDFSGGAGWWQASDGKWYPPEQHPDAAQATPDAGDTPPGGGDDTGRETVALRRNQSGIPSGSGPMPPGAPGGYTASEGPPPGSSPSDAASGGGALGKVVAAIVIIVVLIVVAIIVLA